MTHAPPDPVLFDDWHVVARSEQLEVEKPVAVNLLGEDVVLWRGKDGVAAFRDACVHRGARLSLGKVRDCTLVCPYHGWRYDEQGQCTHIPAQPKLTPPKKAKVSAYRVKEKYGWIWLSLGNPARDVPAFAEWEDDSYRKVHVGPYPFPASGPRIIENFLDVAHFPFVHEGFLGDPAYPEIDEYEAQISPDDEIGVIARDISVFQPDPDGTGEGRRIAYTYKVLRPLTATFVKSSAGARFAMFFTVTPVGERMSFVWAYIAMDYSTLTDDEIRSFQDKITLQDVPVVSSQRPELIALDLAEELHLRSDRISIAYRKWLRQLGLRYGVLT
ncbi:aromatic ring-hydroxylating dioxygenase subunit alpha [Pendulispora brunnea]|uniref:Aromatic ring-hydroxylating dioxygenase subunit alpha n=1 Tax=Pendulispora brunnea TaxID=2905690 RepID=A0ABZ2K0Q2_9BACT